MASGEPGSDPVAKLEAKVAIIRRLEKDLKARKREIRELKESLSSLQAENRALSQSVIARLAEAVGQVESDAKPDRDWDAESVREVWIEVLRLIQKDIDAGLIEPPPDWSETLKSWGVTPATGC